jgi:hypothetical protein
VRLLVGLTLLLLCGCSHRSSGVAVVEADPAKVNPALEGELVHFVGFATAQVELEDPEFKVHAAALRLDRVVEMLQWRQVVHYVDVSTNHGKSHYTRRHLNYDKGWFPYPMDSSHFERKNGHQNPPFPFLSKKFLSSTIEVQGYALPARMFNPVEAGRTTEIASDVQLPASVQLKREGQMLYSGNPSVASMGDLRVHWQQLDAGAYSLIGKQSGTSLVPYPSQSGPGILLVQSGSHTAAEMLAAAKKS